MVTASTDHGVEPQWSSRGNALYYRAESQFMIVPVDASAARPFGTARVFAQGNFADFTGRSYAIAPDGGHLLLKLGAEPATVASIRVVTSWASEIGRPK